MPVNNLAGQGDVFLVIDIPGASLQGLTVSTYYALTPAGLLTAVPLAVPYNSPGLGSANSAAVQNAGGFFRPPRGATGAVLAWNSAATQTGVAGAIITGWPCLDPDPAGGNGALAVAQLAGQNWGLSGQIYIPAFPSVMSGGTANLAANVGNLTAKNLFTLFATTWPSPGAQLSVRGWWV